VIPKGKIDLSANPLDLRPLRITARLQDIARATAWYRDVLGFDVGDCGTALDGAMKYAHMHMPSYGVSLAQVERPALAVSAGQPVLTTYSLDTPRIRRGRSRQSLSAHAADGGQGGGPRTRDASEGDDLPLL
jgi:catechol 2,3-dioxygenase-like lactoylglutathione lyase family enzyme